MQLPLLLLALHKVLQQDGREAMKGTTAVGCCYCMESWQLDACLLQDM
jgi:hypothetical protein